MSDSAFVNGGREVSSLPLSAQMPGMASAADWVTLLKPRVMSLVVFTGLIGMLVAPGSLHPVLGAIAILCIAVATGASGAINMWYDRDIDAVMRRTKNRPIPAGRIEPGEALGYGIVLAVGSVLVMWLATNVVAAAVLAFAIFFYSVIYTMWLKRSTPQNIVIGGAAGAFPPVIGWAAVTGTIDLMPVMMFAIVFFWTPPHFWSLSLWAQMDYERAGVPMLPVVAGARKTRQHIMAYTVLLSVIAVLPWALGDTGRVYGLSAVVLSLGFLVQSWRVLRDKQDEVGLSLTKDAPARAAFKYSLIYLAVLFLALAVDRFV
ncbi:heme o synthase [Granulibacter bethesdensis]|uniref:Protoheme IX farnesyltransferase n=1 Tax=Granulibacter bethesdensis (strain ATCC BAA-1260 / CGDNIH1) TaxID=391165 RepID=COXX_GRABC|nr:RecName: Full=Protoheme IX farnesyltransferase; AltName: Full=Heme B farnesyltransferase; AltName: Full=Heme O synthase [Granulibacter bethesdensis CGDNIH1]